jgi:hypothetical protein
MKRARKGWKEVEGWKEWKDMGAWGHGGLEG